MSDGPWLAAEPRADVDQRAKILGVRHSLD